MSVAIATRLTRDKNHRATSECRPISAMALQTPQHGVPSTDFVINLYRKVIEMKCLSLGKNNLALPYEDREL